MINKEEVLEILRRLRDEGKYNSYEYQVMTKAIEEVEKIKNA